MPSNLDAKVLSLVKKSDPFFRELIEAKDGEPTICFKIRDYAASQLEEKCKKKEFSIPGRFCEQKECTTVDLPIVQPCFQLGWGDGPTDQLETEDFEVFCITACNPYSNVTFKNLTIVAGLIVGPNGGVPDLLPDGTPSVSLTPLEEICFGDLGPCSPRDPSCVTREVVLKTQGAVAGRYFLFFVPCYEVCFHTRNLTLTQLFDFFQFDLVAS